VQKKRRALFAATPLHEFSEGQLYLGFYRGLMYDGSNRPPAEHDRAGKSLASQIMPLDTQGHPDPHGKIVLLSNGFSNSSAKWCAPNLGLPAECSPGGPIPS
jgi:hypothetical protein